MTSTLAGRRASRQEPPEPPRSSRRLPNRKLVLTAVGAALVGALVIWLVAFSTVLGVKSVVVRGEHTLSAATVLAAADVPDGRPLVRVDTAAIQRRVEALADVESAKVTTSLPNTIVIAVIERRPVGYVQAGGGDVLVDRTGAQYRTVSSAPAGLPLFALPSGASATPTGAAVAAVASSLPHSLLVKVASIQAFDPTAITLLLTDQRVVRWGSSFRNADKARILPTLLKQLGTRFDVTNPDLVIAH